MSNKIMEFNKGNGRMALMQEPSVFECTPQLEAILSIAKQLEIMVVFNEPLVCGGIEQIKCVFHPAGYEAVLNHEPGVIKIYEMNTFVDAAALDFERLVLTMMDIWKQTRPEEPQTPKNYRVTPETTPEFQEAIKGKQGIEVGLVESAFFAGFEAASKKATPPAAADNPKSQENPEAIVNRIKAGEEAMGKRDYSLPLWGIADAIRQQMEYHQKNMGTSGESPDWEAGFIEGLKHVLTLIDKAVEAGVKEMENDDLIIRVKGGK